MDDNGQNNHFDLVKTFISHSTIFPKDLVVHSSNPEAVDLKRLIQSYPWNIQLISSGQIFISQGDLVSKLWGLARGKVSARMLDPKGNQIYLESFLPGQTLGLPLLFSSQPRFPVEIIADQDSVMVTLEKSQVLKLMIEYPAVHQLLIKEAGEKIQFLAEKIALFTCNSLIEGLARWFLRQGKLQQSRCITLPFSIETLSQLLGVTRPATSKCLSTLIQEGAIERVSRGVYTIHPEVLKTYDSR